MPQPTTGNSFFEKETKSNNEPLSIKTLKGKSTVNNAKKRKKDIILCKKTPNNNTIKHINIKNQKNNEQQKNLDLAYKTNLTTYIKVLLDAYKSIPNIISIIDKIIETRASNIPTHNIYGNSYLATLNEMNKMIDMSQRKDKLLNLFAITENMLDCLDEKERKIAILKFVQKRTTDEISKETQIAERTLYRTISKIIEKLALYCLDQNWTTQFIKFQIGNEPWLDELYLRKKEEEKTNKIKGEHNKK